MIKLVQDEVKNTAEKILNLVDYNAKKQEAENIDEYVAYEILDLCEWMTPNPSAKDLVLDTILKFGGLNNRTKKIILSFCAPRKG